MILFQKRLYSGVILVNLKDKPQYKLKVNN